MAWRLVLRGRHRHCDPAGRGGAAGLCAAASGVLPAAGCLLSAATAMDSAALAGWLLGAGALGLRGAQAETRFVLNERPRGAAT